MVSNVTQNAFHLLNINLLSFLSKHSPMSHLHELDISTLVPGVSNELQSLSSKHPSSWGYKVKIPELDQLVVLGVVVLFDGESLVTPLHQLKSLTLYGLLTALNHASTHWASILIPTPLGRGLAWRLVSNWSASSILGLRSTCYCLWFYGFMVG